MKYQEQGTTKIVLPRNDREAFALGWLPGFSVLKTIEGGEFRDQTTLTTICVRESDDTWWAMQWSENTEDLTNDLNNYDIHDHIFQVKPIGLGRLGGEWDWVRVK